MALTDENGTNMVMPVAPMYGGNNNGGFGFGDGNGWWIPSDSAEHRNK